MQLHPMWRTCQRALQGPARVSVSVFACRAFSATGVRSRGALPVFLEASKPELSSLLATVNSQLLLPQHLTKEQQELVFRVKNKAMLDAEPVEITLGDVTVPLQHMDKCKLPPRWPTVSAIVRLSETPQDWENVLRMLAGFENAGIGLSSPRQAMIVRKLHRHGQHHLILKALQRPKASGLYMRSWDVAAAVFRAAYDKAALADWDKDETHKALRLATQFVELLEHDEHCGALAGSPDDLRGHPAIIAVPTALAAVMALRHQGPVQDVNQLAGRLVAALGQHDYLKSFQASPQLFAAAQSDFESNTKQQRHAAQAWNHAVRLVWLSNALTTSLKVLGHDMPRSAEAKQYQSEVARLLHDASEALKRWQTKDGKAILGSMTNYIFDVADKTEASP
ncbi:hypothetical protein ACEQ8H_006495 [Pleosporales sp. CAS-2024a]